MALAISQPTSLRSAGTFTCTLTLAKRSVLKWLRTPQLAVLGTIQGALFLLIFRYVFGGAIRVVGVSYVDFLVPGYITTAVLFTAMGTAVGVADDIQGGLINRLRSLPIPRVSAPAGRVVADTGVLVISLAIMTAIGFATGFRVHTDAASALAALGLCMVFGFAFEWLFIYMGLLARTPQAAQSMSLLIVPLTFISSAYVPVDSMPSWMQPVAENQPLTVMVNAVRALTQGSNVALLGHTTEYYVIASLLWAAAMTLVFCPLAMVKYWRA